MDGNESKQLWPTEKIEGFHPLGIGEEIPRNKRTPIVQAWAAITEARWAWIRLFKQLMADNLNHNWGELANPGNYFEQKIVAEAWTAPECYWDGHELYMKILLNDSIYNGDFQRKLLLAKPIMTIGSLVSSSMLAIKSEKSGKHEEAWTYAADAKEELAKLRSTYVEVPVDSKTKKVAPASALANLRHAGDHKLKDEALKCYREKIDPSLSAQKAANILIGIVPISHKTLAQWVSNEKKRIDYEKEIIDLNLERRMKRYLKYFEEKRKKYDMETESQRKESFSIVADKLIGRIHLWCKKLDEIVSAEKKKQS